MKLLEGAEEERARLGPKRHPGHLQALVVRGHRLAVHRDDPAIALTKATAGISVLVVAVFSVGVAATNAMTGRMKSRP